MTEIAEQYMKSILGQQFPLEVPESDIVLIELLRVDSLWNLGRVAEAKAILSNIDIPTQHFFFGRGLQALLDEKLHEAYDNFVHASNHSRGLDAVFYGERAANIAFWLACSGKMLRAAENLPVSTVPFAGGILAFAQHMNGSVDVAEATARKAILDGFNDPWTIHAVAHCLYSQGEPLECSAFLEKYRSHLQKCQPSAFMKGHMEFHLALCYIDVHQELTLENLINGPLWTGLSDLEQKDYWNAAGLLCIHWKAELHGMPRTDVSTIHQALTILRPSASPGKSAVFSLCILRWSTGAFRLEWKKQIQKSDNEVVVAIANAIEAIYPDGVAVFSENACETAMQFLAPVAGKLEKLGASPEQREVLEDFVGVVAKFVADASSVEVTIDMKRWAERNERPNITFYDTILGRK